MTEGERQERRFGRLTDQAEQGLLTYGSYLKIPELLSLQELRSDPPVHDELLFIVIKEYRWWSHTDLATSDEVIFSEDLLSILGGKVE